MYDLEVDRVSEEIRRQRAARVLLQLPDGLRPRALELARALRERTGAEVLISGDSCYGACDLALRQAEDLEAGLIVHYGHSPLHTAAGLPVLYVEARVDVDVGATVERALPLMGGWGRVGLAATVQHAHQLEMAAEHLRLRGLRAVVGLRGGGARHDGQVLGCDYGSARAVAGEVDGFLFIGGGRFHPLGLALATGRPVVVSDPYAAAASIIGEGEVKRLAMRRMAAIAAAGGARRYGIVVSLKPGQFELAAAEGLRRRLEAMGRVAEVICLDEVRAEALNNFSEVDAFIETACPRIALDGVAGLRRPILTLAEAEVMLGERRWEEAWGGYHPAGSWRRGSRG